MYVFEKYKSTVQATLLALGLFFGAATNAQNTNASDRGTPIIPIVPCNCTKWRTSPGPIDSTRKKLFELKFERDGKKYTRTYYLTTYTQKLYDMCEAPANCSGEIRSRSTTSTKITFDEEPDCNIIAFTLPCCFDTVKTVSDIAAITLKGANLNEVVFTPPVIAPSLTAGSAIQLVTASVCGVTKVAQVTAINSDITMGVTPIQFNFASYKNRLENVLTTFLNGGVSPCKPSGSLIPAGNLSYESSYMCCPDNPPCIQTSRKYGGSATWNYGLKCHFPVFGCPYVASLDAVLSAGVSGSVGLNYQTTCTGGKACATLDLKVNAGGGVGFTLAAGLLAGDLQLVIEAGATGELCVYPPPVKLCGKVNVGKIKVVGAVSAAWGIWEHSVDYTVFTGYTTPNFCKSF